jgi:Short repeat of unknown function (DUF308)
MRGRAGRCVPDPCVAGTSLDTATGGWWLFLLVGVLSIAAGVIVLFKPGDSLATLAVIAGIFLLVDGLLELTAALLHGTQSRGMVALLGVLTAIVGILLIRHPIAGVAAVALLIGIWLITIGVIRFVAAFELDENRGLEHLRRCDRADRWRRDHLRPEHRLCNPRPPRWHRLHREWNRPGRSGVGPARAEA